MPFDAHANLAVSVVAVAPSPPDSGTSLTVTAGHGVRFPAPPFNVTIWAASSLPNPTTAEVARCTALVGDVLTLVRAAEPPAPARTVVIGDLVAETITAKALQDIESGVNFPLISTPGAITSGVSVTAPLGQFGGLGTTPLNASQLTTGTVPDARLSANVQLKPIPAGDLPAHATRHQSGGADPVPVTALAGYPGGTTTFLRADSTFATPTAGVPAAHHLTHEPGGSDALAVDAVAATGSLRTLGTGAQQATAGTDARLSNARTPTAHATTHSSGQSDPVTVTALAGYPGGTTNFLRADGTFALPPGGGAPAAHHLTHETGGSDAVVALSGAVITTGTVADARLTVNVLKFTGGYPGGTTTFLRADGTFVAPPGGGGVAAHHLTHEVGGSDQITGAMAISTLAVGTNPATSGGVRLANTSSITARNAANTGDLIVAGAAGDAVVFGANVAGGVYVVVGETLLLRSDAYGVQDRLGTNLYGMDVSQFYPFGSKSLGLPANRWTTGYFGALDLSAALPTLFLNDPTLPAGARNFRLQNNAQQIRIDALNDAGSAVIATPMLGTRLGDLHVGRDILEKGRATPLGHWIDSIAFAAAGFTGTYYVMYAGRTCFISIYCTHPALAAGTPSVTFSLPGITAGVNASVPFIAYAVSTQVGLCELTASTTNLVFRLIGSTFPGGATTIALQTFVPF